MKVQIISMTDNPIELMYAAAKTCYSSKLPNELFEHARPLSLDSTWKFVHRVLRSGHMSIAEHVNFTFAISGISRACSHQLVRHRHSTFSQQSQRYVNLKDLAIFIEPYQFSSTDGSKHSIFEESMELSQRQYNRLIEIGAAPEDARYVLPNATSTNLIFTCNYSELIHIAGLRLCTRAQYEIRHLFHRIRECILEQNEAGKYLYKLLVPKCEFNGFCDEHKSCGKCKLRRVINDDGTITWID